VFDFIADGGIPFAESVLDGGELGKLTLPVWEDAKGFGVAVLIEFTFVSLRQEREWTCRSSLSFSGLLGDRCRPRSEEVGRMNCKYCSI